MGQTPISVNFGKTFNDPNGPWTSTVTDAVFGTGDVAAVLQQHNAAITESLPAADTTRVPTGRAGIRAARPARRTVGGRKVSRWVAQPRAVRPGHGRPRARDRLTLASPPSAAGLLYATPMAVIVAVLFVVPLGLMVWMSFNHWPLLGASEPNGVANYGALRDPLFRRAIVFTLKYTAVTTVVLRLVAFGLALLVQQARPGVGLFRTVFFLPAAVGLASASLLFYGLFNDESSPLNAIVRWLDLSDGAVDWLGTGDSALCLDGRHDDLAVRRLLHADPDDRAAEHRPDCSTRRPAPTAPPRGRSCGRSRCRCCGPRSR